MAQKMVEMKKANAEGQKAIEDLINVRFDFGSIVVAKVGRYPYWPAMVDHCPDTGDFYWLSDFKDLSKKDATHYHVVFFDIPEKVTRSWVHTSKIAHYFTYYPNALKKEEINAVAKLALSSTKRRFVEARLQAEAAALMSVAQREEKYSFVQTYRGKITLFDNAGNKTVIDRTKSARDRPHPASKIKEPRKRKKANANESVDVDLSLISSPLLETNSSFEHDSLVAQNTSTPVAKKRTWGKRKRKKDGTFAPAQSARSVPAVEGPSSSNNTPQKERARKRNGTYARKQMAHTVKNSDPSPSAHTISTEKSSTTSTVESTPSQNGYKVVAGKDKNEQNKQSTSDGLLRGAVGLGNNGCTIENEMSSLLNRIESHVTKPKAVGRNVANLDLLVPIDDPSDVVIDLTSDDERGCNFKCGEIVYANLRGFKPWPALITIDPDTNLWFIPEDGPVNHVHVIFFQLSKNAWVPIENVTLFDGRNNSQEHVNSKQYALAAQEAQHALTLPHSERVKMYSTVNSIVTIL